jgi:hypothetical protein
MLTPHTDAREQTLSDGLSRFVADHLEHASDTDFRFFSEYDRMAVSCAPCAAQYVGPHYAWVKDQQRYNTRCMRCTNVDPLPKATTISRFNLDTICDACEAREKAHPSYPLAARAELLSVQQKEYNFPGIGKPADLQ